MIEARRMTQAEFMYEMNNATRERFNEDLFRRDNYEIVDAVGKVIRSCERDKYYTLKVMEINVIEDYEEIYDTLRKYEQNKIKDKKNIDNIYDYIPMRDSDIILLDVRYLIRKNGTEKIKIDKEEKTVENPEQIIQVLVALPRFVDKYYTKLSGNYYSLVSQLVDMSTYNNVTTNNSKVDSATLKSIFMAVRIYRHFKDVHELNTDTNMRCIIYTSIVFSCHVNAMYYILAKYGVYPTFELFGINYIRITDEPITSKDYYCFKKHNLYISCPKIVFEEPIIQSLCMTIYDGIQKDCTIDEVFGAPYWLKVLGGAYRNASIEKGLAALDSFEYIYDQITKDDFSLPPNEKENMYTILKWMLCNFSAIRAKDNVDVSIKKRRIAEMIAHVYATKLTRGIHRITDMGKKVKLKNIISAVSTHPMYIISTIINMSNTVVYMDMVNDQDALTALKWTYKGISGLGENGAAVQEVYRQIDPSSIGILDPDASSNSDPGMSGMFCPLMKTYGNRFTEFEEPNVWDDTLKDLDKLYRKNKKKKNALNFYDRENFMFGEAYDHIKDNIVKENNLLDRKVCPIKDLDGKIDYSGSGSLIPKEESDFIKPLFKVIDEMED